MRPALALLLFASVAHAQDAAVTIHPPPTWAELVAMPGVEADIRARLEAAESCETARIADAEALDAAKLTALGEADVREALEAQVAELKAQVAELRETKGVACPTCPKRWPAFALGCAVGAGVGVAVYEVGP